MEFKSNKHTKKLNFDNVISYYKPTVILKKKILKDLVSKNKNNEQTIFNSISFKFKFYKITKIKKFIFTRDFKFEPKNSIEFKIYSDFVLD